MRPLEWTWCAERKKKTTHLTHALSMPHFKADAESTCIRMTSHMLDAMHEVDTDKPNTPPPNPDASEWSAGHDSLKMKQGGDPRSSTPGPTHPTGTFPPSHLDTGKAAHLAAQHTAVFHYAKKYTLVALPVRHNPIQCALWHERPRRSPSAQMGSPPIYWPHYPTPSSHTVTPASLSVTKRASSLMIGLSLRLFGSSK